MTENLSPPVAMRTSAILENHGDRREDPYYWLGNRDNPEVLEYLNTEKSIRRTDSGEIGRTV